MKKDNKIALFFDKAISFIANSLRSTAPESSKRLFGAIGFVVAMVYIAIWAHPLIETLLYVSAALLGLEAVAGIFNKTTTK